MTAPHTYITTTIPYVNARPHIGHALELVQADVLARYRRGRGDAVRFQAGTDDNSLKNVLAAQAAGVEVREFVDRNAEAFVALGGTLSLTVDDVIRTSRDPRHRPGVERFWRACSADLYRQRYEGLYCTGCEQFYPPAELRDGRCPEHETVPQQVTEENWFFRLSRYAEPLREAITTGRLCIEPAGRRNEVLAFLDGGLEDFSVSRPAERAGGWGIPVPGDPCQVIYVWFDALCNYVTALGYGRGGEAYQQWWAGPGSRVHLLGKGVLRVSRLRRAASSGGGGRGCRASVRRSAGARCYWAGARRCCGADAAVGASAGRRHAASFVHELPGPRAAGESGKSAAGGGRAELLDAVLYLLARTCSALGRELTPFLPDAAARITSQCTPHDGRLPAPSPVFRRLALAG